MVPVNLELKTLFTIRLPNQDRPPSADRTPNLFPKGLTDPPGNAPDENTRRNL